MSGHGVPVRGLILAIWFVVTAMGVGLASAQELEPGAYAVEVQQERADGPLVETAGITVPPSPETLPAPSGQALLESLAARTGGRVLSLDNPGAVWDAPTTGGSPLRQHRAVWYIPVGLALALFVADVAARMGVWPQLRRLLGGLRQI